MAGPLFTWRDAVGWPRRSKLGYWSIRQPDGRPPGCQCLAVCSLGGDGIDDQQLAWLRSLIAKGDTRPFYRTRIWKRIRREVLESDRHECQWCKIKGRYTPADTVHHVQLLDEHPDLALSKTYVVDGKEQRNLISVCRECHELHHEHLKKPQKPPLTPERW